MVGLVVLYMRFLSCLGCSGQPSTKHFSFTLHYFTLCVPIAKQPRKAVMQDCLSLNMCLWVHHPHGGGLTVKRSKQMTFDFMFSDGKIKPTRWHEIRHYSMKDLLLNIPWSDNAESVVTDTLHVQIVHTVTGFEQFPVKTSWKQPNCRILCP
jgi:hypothetical protein